MQAVVQILVVDDDAKLRSLIAEYLQQHGMEVHQAGDTQTADTILSTQPIDVLVLDWMMPGEDGITYLARRADDLPPVLMLTALGETEDRIAGLEKGAADYLSKPFDPKELFLRVKNLAPQKPNSLVCFGPYQFNPHSNECVDAAGKRIKLTSNEAAMIALLAHTPNQPVAREAVAAALFNISERSVDVQINRLRKALKDNPKHPHYIKTIRNKGYMLCVDTS